MDWWINGGRLDARRAAASSSNPSIHSSMALSHADLLQLKRWNTPTIYNGWEQITRKNPAGDCFNLEETRDFMPQMGPMVGYAVTLIIEPSKAEHKRTNPSARADYRRYVATTPGPKIIVIQD